MTHQFSMEWLKGLESVSGRVFPENTAGILTKEAAVDREAGYDQELFELLRNRRKQLATEANVPPYVIFSDKTLTEMATLFPQSKEGLLTISGVGTVKLKKYGRDFLFLMQEYCRLNKIEDKTVKSDRITAPSGKPIQKKRHQTIGELYNTGRTFQILWPCSISNKPQCWIICLPFSGGQPDPYRQYNR